MSVEIKILTKFKEGLVSFFDELIEQFPTEGDLILARVFINDQTPIKDVMEEFNFRITRNDNQLRKMVKTRNEKFFLDYSVFSELGNEGENKANHFKRIWLSERLDDEDKEAIWNWIDLFVGLADRYVDCKNRN